MTTNAEAVTAAGTLSSLGTNSLVERCLNDAYLNAGSGSEYHRRGAQAVMVLANGDVIISGTTLAPVDPVITIAGTPISLRP